jgi:hypothetical protein
MPANGSHKGVVVMTVWKEQGSSATASADGAGNGWWDWLPLFEALRSRRSRRFGLGMRMNGPLSFESRHDPVPLTEEEQAILAFAASGITGYALNDLTLGPGRGGSMMSGLVGRTVASADAVQSVALLVTDDTGTWLLRRPQDLAAEKLAQVIELSGRGDVVGMYRLLTVRLLDRRAPIPQEPPGTVALNRWSLNAPGSTHFLPIRDVGYVMINGMLEFLNEDSRLFVVDDRATYRPAGLGRFARRRGGHLEDDLRLGRTLPLEAVERVVSEVVTVELGMMIQNLGLACEALGIGGFPNFAMVDGGWLETLGFRTMSMPASRFLRVPFPVRAALRLKRQDVDMRYPIGLEVDGETILRSYAPPYFPSMRAAVEAVVDWKFGTQGIYRGRVTQSAWRHPAGVFEGIAGISELAIEATVAFCEYVFDRYGRFPAYLPPFSTFVGFQAGHLDTEFYDQHYRPEVLTHAHRRHFDSALHRPRAEEA